MGEASLSLFCRTLLVSLTTSAPARRIKSRPKRMSPDEPGRAPERSACKCPWLTTAMTISARLISRARSIAVFMVRYDRSPGNKFAAENCHPPCKNLVEMSESQHRHDAEKPMLDPDLGSYR